MLHRPNENRRRSVSTDPEAAVQEHRSIRLQPQSFLSTDLSKAQTLDNHNMIVVLIFGFFWELFFQSLLVENENAAQRNVHFL